MKLQELRIKLQTPSTKPPSLANATTIEPLIACRNIARTRMHLTTSDGYIYRPPPHSSPRRLRQALYYAGCPTADRIIGAVTARLPYHQLSTLTTPPRLTHALACGFDAPAPQRAYPRLLLVALGPPSRPGHRPPGRRPAWGSSGPAAVGKR